MENAKPWYLSKTILLQLVGLAVVIVGAYNEKVAEFMKVNFSELGIGWAAINVVLRIITNKQIE
jgi:hypothetical protein